MRQLSGRYRLDEPAGQGGMAVVWRGYDLVLRRTVAVKVLSPSLATDRRSGERMRAEALAAAQLSHPRIAALYDYGEAVVDGLRTPYLVMEFVDGQSLAALLRADGPLDWPQAARICGAVAEALAAAHGHGLVHRDVKPGNVMLSTDGVKVVDFGVASPADQDPTDTTGRLWGTPAYLPPELLDGQHATAGGDVYALALLLFECLAGHPPWHGPTVAELLARRRRRPRPDLPPVPGLPGPVAELYRRCLAASPERRPTAAEAAGVLHRAADSAADDGTTTGAAAGPATVSGRPAAAASRTRRTRSRSRLARRIAAAASVPAAAVAGLLALQVAGVVPPNPVAGGSGEQADPAAQVGCTTRYSAQRHADGVFVAELLVTNTGADGLRDWALEFTVPDGHTVTEAGSVPWSQQGRTVVLTPGARFAVGATVKLSLRGAFDPTRSDVPSAFTVGGVECDRAVTQVRLTGRPSTTSPAGSAAGARQRTDGTGAAAPDAAPPRTEPGGAAAPSPATTRPPEPTASVPTAPTTASPSEAPTSTAPASPTPTPPVTGGPTPSSTPSADPEPSPSVTADPPPTTPPPTTPPPTRTPTAEPSTGAPDASAAASPGAEPAPTGGTASADVPAAA